ncbi:MAG: hypothetical protein NZ772_02050 [Cyanobacteria bacterium]|nr:hypothetical protein [Cyanobacteriota bacterium]MDW8200279.1 hypothetical protein [Cyanobacteriota bacterium SKYGB_h_bin112]
MSYLNVWAVVRLLPSMQRVVISRFRRRGDAEKYALILRRSFQNANFVIVFDPPSSELKLAVHSKKLEKFGTSSSSAKIEPRD